MPKTRKPSETTGEVVKKAVPPTKAAPARPLKAAARSTGSVKKPAGAVSAAGSGKAAVRHVEPAGSAKAGTQHARKPAAARGGAHDAVAAAAPPYEADDDQPTVAFLSEQRVLLVAERAGYVRQADELKAEADSLALEHEPGDVQFDEEGGEGGTSNVDRELDLVLSAQARSAITEIDRAMIKIEAGTYGTCEQCGRPIPQARLQALPYAALCVACKSGGLSRR